MGVMLSIVALPMMIGTSELLLIGALVLLLFGGKKLPEMMRGLGQGVRSFKDGMKEGAGPDGEGGKEEKEIKEEQTDGKQ